MAVLLGWQLFYAGPKMKDEQARQRAQQERPSSATRPRMRANAGRRTRGSRARRPRRRAASNSRDDAHQGLAARLPIETPSLKGSIALKGGRIDDLVLVKYHETVDPKSPNVVLFSPTDSPHPYFAEYGWVPPARLDQQGPRPRHAVAGASGAGR